MLSATVKTVLTPVAVVKDAVNVVTGEEAELLKIYFRRQLKMSKKDSMT